MLDESGVQTVYERIQRPGDKFTVTLKGKKPQATFNIYYDGTLVKSVDMDTQGQSTAEETIQPVSSEPGDGN